MHAMMLLSVGGVQRAHRRVGGVGCCPRVVSVRSQDGSELRLLFIHFVFFLGSLTLGRWAKVGLQLWGVNI